VSTLGKTSKRKKDRKTTFELSACELYKDSRTDLRGIWQKSRFGQLTELGGLAGRMQMEGCGGYSGRRETKNQRRTDVVVRKWSSKS